MWLAEAGRCGPNHAPLNGQHAHKLVQIMDLFFVIIHIKYYAFLLKNYVKKMYMGKSTLGIEECTRKLLLCPPERKG